jgi:hypothetical protein
MQKEVVMTVFYPKVKMPEDITAAEIRIADKIAKELSENTDIRFGRAYWIKTGSPVATTFFHQAYLKPPDGQDKIWKEYAEKCLADFHKRIGQ